MSDGFTHLNEDGNAHMVNVAAKSVTERVAIAEAQVLMSDAVRRRLFAGDLPKGDALGVARIAAIMAAKQTSTLVPLCHPIPIDAVDVDIAESDQGVTVTVTARTTAKTGIEMEAMTAASIGAVSIYDMVKGLDRGAEIAAVRLLHKSGGKSGEWNR
ncbi:MAG: cyclic pyranopterin monophosphate synthase MoaC [Acidimicrobiia bacterium]|nr:cyclic pyranopterin monophosphate synthase MoaC [Acidimicrobiia bacterium]MDX2467314.1 cyclic pyranopterin monophosphate synthase MoaC [Acidimicrobiia bacterium]